MDGVSLVPQSPDGMCEFRRAHEQVVGIVSRDRKQAHFGFGQNLGQSGEHADGLKRKRSVYLQRMPAYGSGSTLRGLLLTADDREFVIGSRYGDKLRGFERP